MENEDVLFQMSGAPRINLEGNVRNSNIKFCIITKIMLVNIGICY
jgi:hypothetical protein